MVEDRLYNIIVHQNEITWQDIIYDIIKKEGMDPWDINVSVLTQKYLETLKQLKQMDFKVGGKVLLAAALLLKIKSKRLVGDDLDEFDRLIAQSQISEDEFYDDIAAEYRDTSHLSDQERMRLIPRTPQPRKRQVSIYDLVGALEKALEVKKRRLIKSMPEMKVTVPERTTDITLLIKQIYSKILDFVQQKKQKTVKFSHLIETDTKHDKVYTFVPLLHLHNSRKVDLEQPEHFGEIHIQVKGKP